MKAEIKKGLILLISESKEEMTQIKRLIKNSCAPCCIPKSRKKHAYYKFKNLKISIL